MNKFLATIFLLTLISMSLAHEPSLVNQPIITREFIEHLKTHAPFEVYDYEDAPFKDYTFDDLRAQLCLINIGKDVEEDTHVEHEHHVVDTDTLPTSFDSRTQWPGCVHAIMNQGNCGSCWAFAATEVLSDRFCIASGKKTNIVLSPQHLVDCDTTQLACNGGYISRSWAFLASKGTVTNACYPYTSGSTRTKGVCRTTCTSSTQSFKKYYATTGYKRITSIAAAQQEIVSNGPIETGFSVYSDFYNYRSGIYVHTSGTLLGGHAVKIIGYGVSGSQKYWIVANSWGASWGESGFFRILQGNSGIESQLYAGFADLKRMPNESESENLTFLDDFN